MVDLLRLIADSPGSRSVCIVNINLVYSWVLLYATLCVLPSHHHIECACEVLDHAPTGFTRTLRLPVVVNICGMVVFPKPTRYIM